MRGDRYTGTDYPPVRIAGGARPGSNAVLAQGFNATPPAAFDQTWPESGVDVQVFTVSGVFTKRAGTKAIRVIAYGPGGGGASGSAGTFAGSLFSHGGGAGGAGDRVDMFLNPNDVGATEVVTIGAIGVGGAKRAVTQAAVTGTQGTATSFGALLTAFAGGGGALSNSTAGVSGTSGGGGGAGLTGSGATALSGAAGAAGATGGSIGGFSGLVGADAANDTAGAGGGSSTSANFNGVAKAGNGGKGKGGGSGGGAGGARDGGGGGVVTRQDGGDSGTNLLGQKALGAVSPAIGAAPVHGGAGKVGNWLSAGSGGGGGGVGQDNDGGDGGLGGFPGGGGGGGGGYVPNNEQVHFSGKGGDGGGAILIAISYF